MADIGPELVELAKTLGVGATEIVNLYAAKAATQGTILLLVCCVIFLLCVVGIAALFAHQSKDDKAKEEGRLTEKDAADRTFGRFIILIVLGTFSILSLIGIYNNTIKVAHPEAAAYERLIKEVRG